MNGGNAEGRGLRVLRRCVRIVIGYAAAVLSAAALSMIVAPLLAGVPPDLQGTILLILVAAPILGLKALLLAALAILISEFTRLRTGFYFSLVGVAIGHVVAGDFGLSLFDGVGAVEFSYVCAVFAGLLGGIVYWRVTLRTGGIGL